MHHARHPQAATGTLGGPPPARGLRVGAAVVLAVAVALALLGHGVSWWYAPLALPALVIAHAAVLGGLFVADRSGSRRGGHPGVDDSAEHREPDGDVLHRPRLYDGLVKVLTFGREGRLRRWMVDLAALEEGCDVLDVGSGTGSLLLEAAERVGTSGTLRGVEPSPEMRAQAQRKAHRRGVALPIVAGSATSLPFANGSFDVVFCTLVLHHLPASRREVAVREMRRVLRPGGRLVLVDWQRPSSVVKALLSPMFLTYLLHNLKPGASPLDGPGLGVLLGELGFGKTERYSFGNGGIGAVVGRLDPAP